VSTKGSETFTQRELFAFAKERKDWIAMKRIVFGAATHDAAMWKCFDGDTTTACGPRSDPHFSSSTYLRSRRREPDICTLDSDQPRLRVYADGKRVEEIELKRCPPAGHRARQAVRGREGPYRITSAHANASTVAVASSV